MATEQVSTHAAPAPAVPSALTTIPVVDIPEDARTGGPGKLLFRIRTETGTVDVQADGSFIRCRGAADALEAAGIVRKEWLPGVPGNNRTTQTVVFGASGPSLRLTKGKVVDPCIKILTYGKKFLVLIRPTEQQKARLARAHDEWWRERAPKPEPVRQTYHRTPQVRLHVLDIVDLCQHMSDEGLKAVHAACIGLLQSRRFRLAPAEPCPVISLAAYRRSKASEATEH